MQDAASMRERLLAARPMLQRMVGHPESITALAFYALVFSGCSTPIGSPRGIEPPAAQSEAMLRDIARHLHSGNTIAEVFSAAETTTSQADPSLRRFQMLVVCGVSEISVVADAFQRYSIETMEFRHDNSPNLEREAASFLEVEHELKTLGRGCDWLSVEVGHQWHFIVQLDNAGQLAEAPELRIGPSGGPTPAMRQEQPR